MRVAVLDCETWLIAKGGGAPPLVCMGWAVLEDGELLEAGLVTHKDESTELPSWLDPDVDGEPGLSSTVRALFRWVRESNDDGHPARFVNHNIPFDFAVLASYDDTLIEDIFAMYDDRLVEDTMLREQLMDIAAGSLGYHRGRKTAAGKMIKKRYDLKTLAQLYLKIDLDKLSWRTGYRALYDVPLKDWEEGAIAYGVDDAVYTGKVYFAQREDVAEDIEGGEIPNSTDQARAHWSLHLAAVWGIRTEAKRVYEFRAALRESRGYLAKALRKVGFIRTTNTKKDGSKNLGAVKNEMFAIAEKLSFDLILTPAAEKLELTHRTYKEQENPLKFVSTSKDAIAELAEAGGFSFGDIEEGDGIPEMREAKSSTPLERGVAFAKALADDDTVVIGHDERPIAGPPVAEAKRQIHAHQALELVPLYTSVEKLLTTYVPVLESGINYPINPEYRPLVETGRASCAKPNLMNLPKAPGVRECFIARLGYMFCTVDYTALELHTLAQACLWLVGHSRLAEALNEGVDPHLALACEYLLQGVSYEDGKKIRKDESHPRHKEVEHARSVSKCFHPDTEFLTKTGWKKLEDIGPEEEILQATPRDDGEAPTLSWAVPFNRFKEHRGRIVHLKNEGMDIRVTEDHRMLFFNAKMKPGVCTPLELNKKRGWWNAGFLPDNDDSIDVDETWLRLAVAAQADGSYIEDRHKTVRFGFSKQRKKDRLEKLLRAASLELKGSLDVHTREYESEKMGKCRFYRVRGDAAVKIRELLDGAKRFPLWWKKLSRRSREVVLDEARYWDGHTPPTGVAYQFSGCDEQSHEILQFLATITGRKIRVRRNAAGGENRAPCHKTTIRTRARTRGENLKTTVEEHNGDVVCFSVPESFVVARGGPEAPPVIVGQCANFGLPGGLGAKKFVKFCKGSGVEITLDEAKTLKRNWFRQWPEMRDYFRLISNSITVDENDEEFINVEQCYTARIRGKARYTAACNSYFQGLAADGAKEACYRISHACYVKDSPYNQPVSLYGSRLNVFVHDETIMEHPVETASERGYQQAKIMVDTMQEYTPDVKIKAEPALMTHWNKDAVERFDDNGRLIPWEPLEKTA